MPPWTSATAAALDRATSEGPDPDCTHLSLAKEARTRSGVALLRTAMLANAFPALSHLKLTACGLSSAPAELRLLPNLRYLNLSANPLGLRGLLPLADVLSPQAGRRFRRRPSVASPFPPRVDELLLDRCQLEALPPEVLQHVPWLRQLSVCGNPLGPDGLSPLVSLARRGGLDRLTHVFADDCQLERVPREVVQLPRLAEVHLVGNPLRAPPRHLIADDGAEMLATLRRFLAHGGRGAPNSQFRLVVLGEEQLDVDVDVELPADAPLTAVQWPSDPRLWTAGAVFVLAYDVSARRPEDAVLPWLERLHATVPTATVLLAAVGSAAAAGDDDDDDDDDDEDDVMERVDAAARAAAPAGLTVHPSLAVQDLGPKVIEVARDLDFLQNPIPPEWGEFVAEHRGHAAVPLGKTRMLGAAAVRWMTAAGHAVLFDDVLCLDPAGPRPPELQRAMGHLAWAHELPSEPPPTVAGLWPARKRSYEQAMARDLELSWTPPGLVPVVMATALAAPRPDEAWATGFVHAAGDGVVLGVGAAGNHVRLSARTIDESTARARRTLRELEAHVRVLVAARYPSVLVRRAPDLLEAPDSVALVELEARLGDRPPPAARPLRDAYCFSAHLRAFRAPLRPATHRGTGAAVTIRSVLRSDAPALRALRREAAVLRALRHVGVAQLRELAEEDDAVHLVLAQRLEPLAITAARQETEAAAVLEPLLQVVGYLRSLGAAHGAIRPAAVALGPATGPVLVRLATCTLPLDDCGEPEQLSAAGAWVPPEGRPCDVYALGVLLLQLLTGGDVPPRDDYGRPHMPELRLLAALSEPCRDVLHRMLTPDPELRAEPEELLRHQWFDAVASDSDG